MGGLVSVVAPLIKAVQQPQQQQIQQPVDNSFASKIASSISVVEPQQQIQPAQPVQNLTQPQAMQSVQPLTTVPQNTINTGNTLASVGQNTQLENMSPLGSNADTEALIRQLIEILSRTGTQGAASSFYSPQQQSKTVNPYTINPYNYGYGQNSLFGGFFRNNNWY